MKIELKTYKPQIKPDNTRQNLLYRNKTDSFKKNDICFSGLKIYSKQIFSKDDLINFKYLFPNSNGIVGNLPSELIKKFPEKNKRENIKKFYDDFGSELSNLRGHKRNPIQRAIVSSRINKIFKKAGIIDKNQTVTLKKLGSGKYGTAYLLKDNDAFSNKYVIKVFHRFNDYTRGHGIYREANNATFWRNNTAKNNQRAIFYYADLHNGIMLTKYADNKNRKIFFDPFSVGLTSADDKEHNIIDGIYIDYGGLNVIDELIANNPTIRKIHKKMKQNLLNFYTNEKNRSKTNNNFNIWKNIFKSKKHQNLYSKMALAKTIDCLPEDKRKECFIELVSLNETRVNSILLKSIFIIPDKERVECLTALAEKADTELKQEIIATMRNNRIGLNYKNMFDLFNSIVKNLSKELDLLIKDDLAIINKNSNFIDDKVIHQYWDQILKKIITHKKPAEKYNPQKDYLLKDFIN